MATKSSQDHRVEPQTFTFGVGDVVIVRWCDGMLYFAKIVNLNWSSRKCLVKFMDKKSEEANFSDIQGGKFTYFCLLSYCDLLL